MKIATLVFPVREKEILLGLKQGGPEIGAGKLNGPGGKKELIDKNVFDCAARETLEEIGIELDPEATEKVAIITFRIGNTIFQKVHIYLSTRWKGEPHTTKSMIPYWFGSSNLPLERMHESDRAWLPRLIRGEKFCLDVYYREPGRGFLGMGLFLPFVDEE